MSPKEIIHGHPNTDSLSPQTLPPSPPCSILPVTSKSQYVPSNQSVGCIHHAVAHITPLVLQIPLILVHCPRCHLKLPHHGHCRLALSQMLYRGDVLGHPSPARHSNVKRTQSSSISGLHPLTKVSATLKEPGSGNSQCTGVPAPPSHSLGPAFL